MTALLIWIALQPVHVYMACALLTARDRRRA